MRSGRETGGDRIPAVVLRGWGLAAALAAVALLWAWPFRGVLFHGRNYAGYPLLDARITGVPDAPARGKPNQSLPGRDASFLLMHLPFQAFLARNFQEGRFPLWNPETGCGQPVTSDPQYKPYNPFFWPYFAHPTARTFSLAIAAIALFGMAGFVLYLREVGLGWAACAAGGFLMAFNPMTQQMLVLSSPWALWPFAWGLWGAERWCRGSGSGLPTAAAASALMIYAGHPVIGAWYGAVLAVYILLRPEGISVCRRVTAAATVSAAALLLGAVHVLPFLANFGLYANYKTAWDGGPGHDWWLLSDPKSLIYVPMPLWALAAAGLGRGTVRLRIFFGALAAYGALVMFPWIGNGPVRWVLTMGGVLVARYGQEAFWLGLGGLAALGIESLAASWRSGERWAAPRFFLHGAAWHYVLAWLVQEVHFSLFWPRVFRTLAVAELLAALPVVLIPLLPRGRAWTGAAAAAFLGAAACPFLLPTSPSRYETEADWTRKPPPIVEGIAPPGGGEASVRISGARYAHDYLADLCPNQNLFWSLSDVRLTNPIILETYADFAQHWNTANIYMTTCYLPRQNAELMRFLGVRWTVRDAARPDPDLPVRRTEGPLALQEVEGFRPWARLVSGWEAGVARPDELRRTYSLLRSGGWTDRVVLDAEPATAPGPPTGGDARISWRERGPNRFRWEVSSTSGGMFVVLQNAHRGWRATLDGSPARIFRAYGTFQALVLPPGQHSVTLEFREPWWVAGLSVTLAAWLGVGIWAVLAWRRGRAHG